MAIVKSNVEVVEKAVRTGSPTCIVSQAVVTQSFGCLTCGADDLAVPFPAGSGAKEVSGAERREAPKPHPSLRRRRDETAALAAVTLTAPANAAPAVRIAAFL